MSMWLIIGVVIIALLGIIAGKNKKPRQQHTPIHAKAILTRREQQFFAVLQQAMPRAYIFPQVSFSAILTTKGFYTRSQFNRKIADFVLCDQDLEIVAIIELDDRSHQGREQQDAARDAMLHEAGYAVLRYTQIPSAGQLQKDLYKYFK
ncbi:DUF2726 domain-containing protein [Alkanindiges illinoisensis]|uniref:DUF2726 domain-containing protein n=1 Tax=Alkanindiges illinoisensis TaxID=197183 RepID=A0A4Y7XDC5_9GAMM|nr:DUF2726 domain-containing protein [Alkanindiges illinoisensis]TEU28638.1 DUF2726 domain-containing protein [Alkanindiges illinoisensis]